jgi:hypothetical protein
MNAADFELNLSLPAEERFATTMRDLAAHAARYAGCTEQDAERFGAAVEGVVRQCFERAGAGAEVPAVIRRGAGPVEFLIGCEGRFDAATHEGRVTVGWTREEGTAMCRVAMDL